jgi:N-formylglutamate deformylase
LSGNGFAPFVLNPMSSSFEVHAEAASAGSALVFDSPHSWPHWPVDAPPTVCPAVALRSSCDAWVDEIWREAIAGAAPLLCAHFHRAYIDANRARDDIDPSMLAEPWPTALNPGEKSRRGFGLIRRLALPDAPLYDRPLALEDIEHRLHHCYDPYHAKLASLINAAHERHGFVLHINCHSMKSVGNAMNDDAGMPRPDIVVSDLNGQCASPLLMRWIAATLGAMGYRVGVNDPYQGAELIRRHGAPDQGRHSVQIELNRALYMDEAAFAKTEGYSRLVSDLRLFVGEMAQGLAIDHAGQPLRR